MTRRTQESVGTCLLVLGAASFGYALGVAIIGSARSLSPLEALAFVNGLAAIACGIWMMFRQP